MQTWLQNGISWVKMHLILNISISAKMVLCTKNSVYLAQTITLAHAHYLAAPILNMFVLDSLSFLDSPLELGLMDLYKKPL